jgi:hypothetical protein
MKIPTLVRIMTARPRVISFHGLRSKRLVADLHNVNKGCFYHVYIGKCYKEVSFENFYNFSTVNIFKR